MTLQEAIDCIDDVLSSDYNYDETLGYQLTSYDFDWLEEAKKSLEKQIRKNLNTETVNHGISVSGEYDIDFNYLCPSCGVVVGDCETNDIFYKFCPECGQALK